LRVLFFSLNMEFMASIGVFDSGVGGLTVLRELASHFPSENFIYLGDTARLPYGTKSPETIRQYSEQILEFLISQKVDALVIACNTASSQVLEKEWKGTPVLNVIEPGAQFAVETSQSQRIGVLGTRALIASAAYPKEIHRLSPKAEVFTQSCPLFVPLAEEGWIEDPITNLIAYRYLHPLLESQIDTLILGCTHYPLLKSAITRACGASVQLVDSGQALARQLEKTYESGRLVKSSSARGEIHMMLTDFSPHTKALAQQILEPLTVSKFEIVHL
jgi:glutamate racemase